MIQLLGDGMTHEVFISYSRHDANAVNKFVDRLEQEDISVWVDRDGIESGDEFKEVIIQAIKDSSIVLFFSSKYANQSNWTAKEIGIAVKYNKPIIPVLLDDSKFNGAVEFDLVNRDFVDYYNSSNRNDNMEKLVRSIKNKLSKSSDKDENSLGGGHKGPNKQFLFWLIVPMVVVFGVAILLLRVKELTIFPTEPLPTLPSPPTDLNNSSEENQFSHDLVITVNGVSFVMKYVEGGTFQMGATKEQGTIDPWDDEKPVHNVTVSTFHMGETEITQALWKSVMGTEPTNKGGWTSQYGRGDDYPAYMVSWNDCQKFIKDLNKLTGKQFRMPTEAEWEFAARGGNKGEHFKYAGDNVVEYVAWHKDNSNGKSHPVKKAKPNELGLYDMSGNVWEWCVDSYEKYTESDQINPNYKSNGDNKVLRSGSWSSVAGGCRVSSRYGDASNSHKPNYGLRLILPR